MTTSPPADTSCFVCNDWRHLYEAAAADMAEAREDTERARQYARECEAATRYVSGDLAAARAEIERLRDALMAYMEPAGDTPEELRIQGKAALYPKKVVT